MSDSPNLSYLAKAQEAWACCTAFRKELVELIERHTATSEETFEVIDAGDVGERMKQLSKRGWECDTPEQVGDDTALMKYSLYASRERCSCKRSSKPST